MPRITLRILIVLVLGALGILLCAAARAHADTSAVDPAVPEVSRIVELWRGGQILQAVMLAVLGVLVIARKRIAWLQVGNRLLYVTAAITGVVAFVEALDRGTTPTLGLAMTAVMSAVMIVIKAHGAPPPPPLAPSPPPAEPTP